MQLAILATIAGALADAGFRALVHRSGFRAEQLPRLPLSNRDELFRPHVTRVLGPLRLSAFALSGFVGQFLNARLKLGVTAKVHDRFRLLRQHDLQHGPNAPIKSLCFWCRWHGLNLPQAPLNWQRCPDDLPLGMTTAFTNDRHFRAAGFEGLF